MGSSLRTDRLRMRVPQQLCRRGGAAAEGAEKRAELPHLAVAEPQRFDLAVTGRRGGRAVVVRDDVFESSDLAGMHIGRALRDVSQRRHFERALEGMALGQQKVELR